MKSAILGLALLALSLPAFGKNHEMHTGKVISQDIGQNQVARGLMTGTPIVRYSNTVTVETDHERMTWSEVSNYWSGTRTQDVRNALPLPVNGEVKFYRDGNYCIVQDEDHKDHKFLIVHLEELP